MSSGYLCGLLVDVIQNSTEGYQNEKQRNGSNTGILVHLKNQIFRRLLKLRVS